MSLEGFLATGALILSALGYLLNRRKGRTDSYQTLSETVTILATRLKTIEMENIAKTQLIEQLRLSELSLKATVATQSDTIERIQLENSQLRSAVNTLGVDLAKVKAELTEFKKDTGDLKKPPRPE